MVRFLAAVLLALALLLGSTHSWDSAVTAWSFSIGIGLLAIDAAWREAIRIRRAAEARLARG